MTDPDNYVAVPRDVDGSVILNTVYLSFWSSSRSKGESYVYHSMIEKMKAYSSIAAAAGLSITMQLIRASNNNESPVDSTHFLSITMDDTQCSAALMIHGIDPSDAAGAHNMTELLNTTMINSSISMSTKIGSMVVLGTYQRPIARFWSSFIGNTGHVIVIRPSVVINRMTVPNQYLCHNSTTNKVDSTAVTLVKIRASQCMYVCPHI